METRRLELLVALSRLGSMRAVADAMHVTTSTVSQQLAVLATEAGATLIEPDGRRVRLTPAGRRLADHAVTILAAVEAARLSLDPGAEPAGTLRVAGFTTAIRRTLLPVLTTLARDHPKVTLLVHEHEPDESLALLATDDIDLALVYDYNLVPARLDRTVLPIPLWTVPWSLGVPVDAVSVPDDNAVAVIGRFADTPWIVNSRNNVDETVVRILASMAGFDPEVTHRADSVELVQDLIVAGLGVGLLPADQEVRPGVRLVPLTDPDVLMRGSAVIRRGRADWPPLALVLDLLADRP